MGIAMLKTILAGLAVLLVSTSAASALTVTNKSQKEISIGVHEGDKSTVHKIAAGQTLTLKTECNDGCGVTGPWNFSWKAKTGDSIETDGSCLTCAGTQKAETQAKPQGQANPGPKL
jgi:hypothetical protein